MKDNEDKKSDRDYEELRLLYQMAVSDIALFKQQQWKIINYGLLLYAAINAIPKILDDAVTNIEFFFLFIVAFTILSTGCFLLGLLEKSIKKGRAVQID